MSRLMGKPTIYICENKDADQLRGTAKLISAFVFATRIVQSLYFLNTKFHDSSSLLCLYRPVCVGPVRKPHCWFSHEAAHIHAIILIGLFFINNRVQNKERSIYHIQTLTKMRTPQIRRTLHVLIITYSLMKDMFKDRDYLR